MAGRGVEQSGGAEISRGKKAIHLWLGPAQQDVWLLPPRSDRILRTMGSLRGAFANFITGQYDKGDAKNTKRGSTPVPRARTARSARQGGSGEFLAK